MALMLCALAVSCLSLVASLSTDAVSQQLLTSAKERPVMKVVRLLQDMKAQLEGELEDDKAVHEKLGCWCKSNDEEKTTAIATGEAKEIQLETFLGEAAARMAQMKTKRDATLQEVDRDVEALEEARTLRMKENKEFHAEDANFLEAIKACDQAITVLKEYNPNSAGLAQVRAVAQRLQRAKVLSLSRQSADGPTSAQMAALKAFLSQAQGSVSFLSIPGYQSYAPESGQIYGVLEQLKEDFEKDLSDATAKEKKASAEFLALKAAKEEEITAGRALVAELDSEIASLKAKHAEAFKELEDTQAQLDLDRIFLADLKKRCSESSSEFDLRVKDRTTEIAAVADTIAILNSDTSFDNFENTVNSAFVQVTSLVQNTETEQQREKLSRVATSLQKSAALLGAPKLALLASAAKLDTFTKVKELIDKMVVELGKQNQDEIAHRDWCIKELASNNHSTEEAYDKKASLTAEAAEYEKTISYLTKEIKESVAAVAEMQEQMKRASATREAENAAYQTTVADQRTTQIILKKALGRMKQVYAFMQEPGAPHIQTSGTHTDAGNGPARFTKYDKNANGGRIVRMLEEVITDSQKMEDDAISSEEDSQEAYENFMKASNKGIKAYNKKMVNMKGAKASAEEYLVVTKSDINSNLRKLEELHETLGDLKSSCDFVMNNFKVRQEARTAEINALNEAKAILSGMK
jgi:hypothetical protein